MPLIHSIYIYNAQNTQNMEHTHTHNKVTWDASQADVAPDPHPSSRHLWLWRVCKGGGGGGGVNHLLHCVYVSGSVALVWVVICGCEYVGDCVRAAPQCVLQHGAAWCSLLRCIGVCWSVIQCVAVCCSVLQCVTVCAARTPARARPPVRCMLQCAPACCSVPQCVAVSPSVLQCVPVGCSVPQYAANVKLVCASVCCSVPQCVAVCFSVLQCAPVCCSYSNVLLCVAACSSDLRRAPVCCSALQCVVVCCSVLQCVAV